MTRARSSPGSGRPSPSTRSVSSWSWRGGLDLARELSGAGKRVFLDMKLLDIENTVERATRNAAATGATFLTVHAHDAKTLRAALAGKAGTDLEILGVTVLTNLDAADIRAAGLSTPRRPTSSRAAPRSRAMPAATAWWHPARRRRACAPSSGRAWRS